ncbi:MAG: FAD-dependent oxidoreductase [Gammaproteobacteria bacterium]|nr:FAD-dependent oxidoreductase [Gammaproteobacteria bacterium]
MATTYQYPEYAFTPPPELGRGRAGHFPVVIVGAGPIGLATAIDLHRKGIRSVILDEDNTVSVGSRAICWAKRTLEILDRLGCGERMLAKGVTWNTGKVFFRDDPQPVYSYNLLQDRGQHYPAFINLQQYYAEEFLVDTVAAHGLAELRWRSEVVGVQPAADHVTVRVRTPAGEYDLTCDWLIACDGSRSPVRTMLGLTAEGETFNDHFLIADIRMEADLPSERRYWFDPPFNPDYSALLHMQPDDVWRIDFQLGSDIDRDEELKPENVGRRIRAMLGEDMKFEYEWLSIYTFRCQRMRNFVHDRVIFAGDSAHLVSPFGARGANSGIQDVDNLVWKLALVMQGKAPPSLLDSYDAERTYAADENICNSTRSIDFMTPRTEVSRMFRDATLELAREFEFARRFVNSGRLSVPAVLHDSPLNADDGDDFNRRQCPGSPCLDAPVMVDGEASWLLRQLGEEFINLYFATGTEPDPASLRALAGDDVPVRTKVIRPAGATASGPDELVDIQGLVGQHFDVRPGSCYLIRPDQHVTGRWREFDPDRVARARDLACGRG